ncbi:GNAT family N-acetyltransferase [Ruegeria sp. 2205SS24-7]|uniref:GNAT family N-acetyltransferase n=1 Tax=Ruegeria discodermiae TaxID=3064389 RepID=UPI002741A5F7|nr:GNAT family N-acetyltransferase [Ruegeria sp. 2205SS24-7]MDP5215922.1 GNAT family N-acetyltransferase [Ruegeria sp. 2205SS24-7]
MRDAFTIREAGTDDLASLLELYTHLTINNLPFSVETAEDIFRRFSLYDGSALLLGEVDGELVASCALVVIPNLTRGGTPYALVENVVTHTDHRCRGYGKRILDAASQRAWDQGCYKVMLMTGSKKPATLAFYERAGFRQTKTGFQKRADEGR